MYKLLCAALITAALLHAAQGKRSRKKYAEEAQESTPQPSVLTYSTFGFNDVGTYSGFLPSSPDYANYLNQNRDQNTRLYAPAFPSAADAGFGNEPITAEGQNVQNNFQTAANFFTSPSADYKGKIVTEGVYGQTSEDAPSYGAKLSKSKNKLLTDVNNTGINIYGSVSSITESEASNERNPFRPHAQALSDPKVPPGEPNNSPSNAFRQPYHSYEVHEYEKPTSTPNPPYNFPKVVDFTKLKQNYPTNVDNKYVDMSQKPFNLDALISGDENSNINTYSQPATNQMFQSKYEYKEPSENEGAKFSSFHYENPSDNSIHSALPKHKVNSEYKDKVKSRPLHFNNEERKKFKSNMKGYEYSTNHSTTSFKYDYGSPRPNFNSSVDEISPASSNLGFTSYQLPENSVSAFSDIAKIPGIKNFYDAEPSKGLSFYQEKPVVEETFEYKPPFPIRQKPVEEPTYEFKSPYTTVPTSSSHWGSIFKESGYSIPKTHPWKQNTQHDDIDIVHIPKKHENHKYVKQFGNPSEWSYNGYRPLKSSYKPQMDWSDYSTRYKSEEDLLGLRNHDTSQPNNLPNYKPGYSDFDEEVDYRKLVEKWRQNYIRTKHKEALREYEPYASDAKPVRVPMSRPYPIEVPHPVIVPVPQPYPVKIPVPKPVAVPVIREVTVPVEKPVPYPVVKKVPYPVEKPVAVPVVKQVHVPVVKPYPVTIPQIKPVFHHSKRDEDDDDEYQRPDKPYYKKSKNHRSRPRTPPSRRPSRMTYDRKRRPYSRPSGPSDHGLRRPSQARDQARDPAYRDRPHRYHEDFEEYDDSDYAIYCKRTGRC